MKRFFILAALMWLALLPSVRGEGPDDAYVQIYNLIQEADSLSTRQPAQALVEYRDAQTALERFRKNYPSWNNKIVDFRVNYVTSKITILTGGAASPSLSPSTVTNKPAAPAPGSAVSPLPAPTPSNTPVPAPARPVVVPVTPPRAQVTPPPVASPNTELEKQLAAIQNQLRQLQNEKTLLEAKLREALSAQPATADPRELAKAEERIRALQKQNDLLQVSLAQQRTQAVAVAAPPATDEMRQELVNLKRQLEAQTARATKLAQDNESLQTRIKTLSDENQAIITLRNENEVLKRLAENRPAINATPNPAPAPASTDAERQLAEAHARIAALESDKEIWRLEKIALQNRIKQLSSPPVATSTIPTWTEDSERVKHLERERDDLRRQLEAAQKELYGRKNKTAVARIDQLNTQLTVLRARLEVLEAKPVPYTPQELALFKRPEPVLPVTDPKAGKKSVQELPPGTSALVAEAQRDFAARRFDRAEEKYLEVLRHDDRNVNTLANLAAIQLEMNNLPEAEKHIQQALAVAPDDAYSLSILGHIKYRQEKYDDALNSLSHAAKLDPQNAEIQNYLGLTLSQKGLRVPAETALRKAIQLQPNYGSAHNNLAVIYLTQQPPMTELARWHYQKALATGFPRNPDLEKMLEPKKAPEPVEAAPATETPPAETPAQSQPAPVPSETPAPVAPPQ